MGSVKCYSEMNHIFGNIIFRARVNAPDANKNKNWFSKYHPNGFLRVFIFVKKYTPIRCFKYQHNAQNGLKRHFGDLISKKSLTKTTLIKILNC